MPGQKPGIRFFGIAWRAVPTSSAGPDRALPPPAGNCYVHAEAGSTGCEQRDGRAS